LTTVSSSAPGPFDRAFLRLTVGLIAAITLVSFEALGVAAALPAAAQELNGERWYGAAFSLLMLGQLVGTAALGNSIDKRGPRPGFLVGLLVLVVGLIVGGTAQHIVMLLISRLLVGVGAGAIFTVGFATVGLGYPEELRPRVNAAVSSAWVLPGLLGPGLAGWLTDRYTWRLALFGVIPVAVIAGFLVIPALPKTVSAQTDTTARVVGEDPFWRLSQRRRMTLGISVAIGAWSLLVGLANLQWWPLILVGAAAMGVALRGGLLPMVTFRATFGLGATIASTSLLIAGYSGVEALVPLVLQRLRGLSSARAGLTLTLASVAWFIGSWIHGRQPAVLRRGINAPIAVVAVGIGALSVAALSWPWFPLWGTLVLWGVGALAMGLVYNLLSERPFQLVALTEVGVTSSAIQIGSALAAAISTGVGGSLIAQFGTEDSAGKTVATATGLSLAIGFAVVCLAVCALTIRRSLQPEVTIVKPSESARK
jgi:MFS family permease